MERFHRATYKPINNNENSGYEVFEVSLEGWVVLDNNDIKEICDEIIGRPVFEKNQAEYFICKLFNKGHYKIPVYVLITPLYKKKNPKYFVYQLLFYNAFHNDVFINPDEVSASSDYYYDEQIKQDGFLDFDYDAAGFEIDYKEYVPYKDFHDFWHSRNYPITF